MVPGLVIGPIGQVVNAARQKQQLDGYRDQVLIDALDVVSQQASQAAKAIVDEAEAILTKAEVCRLANDDANAVHVRITEYFKNHPRLTTLQDALEVLARLLEPLRGRAGRLLQLPKTKRARKDAVQRFLASANAMQEFADSLFLEFGYLPGGGTGLAVVPLGRIDAVMTMDDREARLARRGELLATVEEGRGEVQQSRLKRAAAGLGTTMAEARTAFL
jgi:hypothetical protein